MDVRRRVGQNVCRSGCIAIFCALIIVSSGCTGGKGPFQMVQMCLADREDATAFIGEMDSIAQAKGFTFVDGSANTKRSVEELGYANPRTTQGSPSIDIGIRDRKGLLAAAGNLGLPGYEVAIGFNETTDPVAARQFAEFAIGRLQRRWHVEILPPGVSATQ
jgi:hypothetical protein